MTILIGLRSEKTGQGFTLIELVLATVLLLLLLGAAVFNYSTLQRGTTLDEGVAQLETLLRYSQAQAAITGRKVQLVFEEEVDEGITVAFGNLRAVWEPDPLGQPGQLSDLPGAADLVSHLVDLVQVESVRPFEPGEGLPVPSSQTNDAAGANALAELMTPDYQPPISFFPDGSSDSADITVAARDPEDLRRVTVRLIGLTGAIQRLAPVDESETVEESPEPKPATTTTIPQPATPALTPPASTEPE